MNVGGSYAISCEFLIFWNGCVYFVRPCGNATAEIFYLEEPGLLEKLNGLCAASATFAVSYDFAAVQRDNPIQTFTPKCSN